MMKKLLPLAALAIGVLFSAQASATAGAIAASATLGPVGTNTCEALANNVTIQLSNGVVAGWDCSNTDFYAGTCHTTGTNKQQTITCTYTQDASDKSKWIPDSVVCPAYDATAGSVVKATFAGRVGFKGNSLGGSVSAQQLGTDTTVCDIDTVTTFSARPTAN